MTDPINQGDTVRLFQRKLDSELQDFLTKFPEAGFHTFVVSYTMGSGRDDGDRIIGFNIDKGLYPDWKLENLEIWEKNVFLAGKGGLVDLYEQGDMRAY